MFGEFWLFSAMENKPSFMKEAAYRAEKSDSNFDTNCAATLRGPLRTSQNNKVEVEETKYGA